MDDGVTGVTGGSSDTPKVNAVTPIITHDLTDKATSADTVVTLDATATITDMGTLSYSWYSAADSNKTDAAAILGATSAVYAPPVNVVGTFYYYCVVTNTYNEASGSKTSSVSSAVSKVTVVPYIPVTSMSVELPVVTVGKEFDLTAINVNPGDATNKTVIWSVKSGGTTGVATDNLATGKFTPTTAGTLVLTATITNGTTASTNYTQDVTLEVTEFVFAMLEGKLTIIGYYDTNVVDIVVPSTIGGVAVYAFSSEFFDSCTKVRSIEVPMAIIFEAPEGFTWLGNNKWVKPEK